MTKDVEIEVEENQIIIRPVSKPRAGCDVAFRAMAANNDDALISGEDNISHSWDEKEWQG